MYLQHFGLNELPFRLVPAPGFFCATGVRRQILDALPALLRSGESLVAIIGDAGTGKTVLSRRLTEQLSDEAVVLELSGASLGSSDLLGALLEAIEESRTSENAQDPPLLSGALPGLLGAVLERAPFTSLLAGVVGRAAELLGSAAQQQSERTVAPTRVLRSISRRVLDLAEEGRRLVVLIDDAHCLCARSLEALQLLADLEPEPPHRVQIVLLGLPELHARLIVPPASSLGQRLTYSFELGTLERVELESYVSGRLAHAGCENPTLFSGCALDAVLEATGGVPRLVNVICHGSLTQGLRGRGRRGAAAPRAALGAGSRWGNPDRDDGASQAGTAAGLVHGGPAAHASGSRALASRLQGAAAHSCEPPISASSTTRAAKPGAEAAFPASREVGRRAARGSGRCRPPGKRSPAGPERRAGADVPAGRGAAPG